MAATGGTASAMWRADAGMTHWVDPALLLLALAGIAGGSAVALLGTSWIRQRRAAVGDTARTRRMPPAPDADDPILASLRLPRERRGRPER